MSLFYSLLLLFILPVAITATIFAAKYFLDKKAKEEEEDHDEKKRAVWLKKNRSADLEYYRGLFFRLGFVFALGFVLVAFSWTQRDEIIDLQGSMDLPDEIEIEPPPTKQPPPPPPPPPPPELEIVENEEEIEEEVEIEDMDVTEETAIDIPDDIPEEEPANDQVFVRVEQMPIFPGGETALRTYLAKVDYPQIAIDNDIEGTVFVEWVVNQNGKVSNVKILKGADPLLDEAAKKHISRMPKWTPGKQRGKPVRVIMRAPIRFKLS